MRINFADAEQKVEQILRGWETTTPEQSFGDMTLEHFKQALQPWISGLYATPLPNAVCREAAGVIVAVGQKVKGFKKGDRVAYCGELGAYCQERLMVTNQLVHVHIGVSDEKAAAIMLKGMTTEYLIDHTSKAWL